MILVTGGAGFIGATFVMEWLAREQEPVVNLDKLTYAGNLFTLRSVLPRPQHIFVHGDIADRELVSRLLGEHNVRAVVNFAAETHVDRSVRDAGAFVQTNVVGTFHLLESVRAYWNELPQARKDEFRFLHVSTDEVYGDLAPGEAPFCETTPYRPSNPYSASKAAGDHLVRAWHRTHGLPTLITHCGNNYGPHQFPEKLIPLTILNALSAKALPVYGDGMQIRDWLHVADHCAAIRCALKAGKPGDTYNIGGGNEKANMETVKTICAILDEIKPRTDAKSYASQIEYVRERPGHDRRYATDARKIRRELGWTPGESFETGIRKTVRWYLENPEWIESATSSTYRDWVALHYKEA